MKLIITIDIPDGLKAELNAVEATEPEYVPPFADELIPLRDDATPRQLMGQALNIPPGYAEGAALVRTMAQNPSPGCPVHRVPWKTVPAGVSKKSGKPYAAFMACPERGCDQRPAA